jgi:sugar phosphate isomerase/epimerase
VPWNRVSGGERENPPEQVVGTLFADTVHRRRYCGEGTFDLPAMITSLRTAGWNGPWGVEILSEEHRSQPVDEALQRASASARRVLDRARKDADGERTDVAVQPDGAVDRLSMTPPSG